MLRDDGRRQTKRKTELSAAARLLLRADHDRGLHLAPIADCEMCALGDVQSAAHGMEAAKA